MDFSVFENYEVEGQISLFDLTMPTFKIDKPIRLIELFAGVGSQAMSLRDLGADFEHYRVVEFEKYYINNEKAQKLIDTLIENGTLVDRQTDRRQSCTECQVISMSQAQDKQKWQQPCVQEITKVLTTLDQME